MLDVVECPLELVVVCVGAAVWVFVVALGWSVLVLGWSLGAGFVGFKVSVVVWVFAVALGWSVLALCWSVAVLGVSAGSVVGFVVVPMVPVPALTLRWSAGLVSAVLRLGDVAFVLGEGSGILGVDVPLVPDVGHIGNAILLAAPPVTQFCSLPSLAPGTLSALPCRSFAVLSTPVSEPLAPSSPSSACPPKTP